MSATEYWAFITHSPQDMATAAQLHRAIENYGIPAQLLGQVTPLGEKVPARLRPVFRPAQTVRAAGSSNPRVERALRASRYLIVICSPTAPKCAEIDRDIEAFVAGGGRDRVLAMIAPKAEGATSRACFPAGLQALSPLAADARRSGDGLENAKLKLLAGMLGVSFDALRQRDHQRRMRRLRLVLALSLLAGGAMAALAFYADQQRRDAEQAAAQAAGLADFMLDDVTRTLEPLGDLALIDSLQAEVKKYLDENYGDPDFADSNEALHRLVNSALARADIAVRQGNFVAARARLAESSRYADRILWLAPHKAFGFWAQARQHYLLGWMLLLEKRPAEAGNEIRQSIALYSALTRGAHEGGDYPILAHDGGVFASLAGAYELLADALSGERRFPAAGNMLEAARVQLEEARKRMPGNPRIRSELAGISVKLIALHHRAGNVEKAYEDGRQAYAAYKALVDEFPLRADFREGFARALIAIAQVEKIEGQRDTARTRVEYAVGLLRDNVNSDPTNIDWRRGLLFGYMRLAKLLEEMNDAAAEAYWKATRDLATELEQKHVSLEPEVVEALKRHAAH